MSKHDKGLRRLHSAGGQQTVARHVVDPITLGTDGSILINSALLAPPTTIYDADVAWVTRRFDAVSLFFGKEAIDKPGTLHSRLELRYPDEQFVQHLVRNIKEFHKGLKEQVSKWTLDRAHVAADYSTLPAQRAHSEWVNFNHLARIGSQACLDFYHLSPAALARYVMKQGSEGLEMVPRVRVLTTIQELARLLDSSESIAEEIVKFLPPEFLSNNKEQAPQESV